MHFVGRHTENMHGLATRRKPCKGPAIDTYASRRCPTRVNLINLRACSLACLYTKSHETLGHHVSKEQELTFWSKTI